MIRVTELLYVTFPLLANSTKQILFVTRVCSRTPSGSYYWLQHIPTTSIPIEKAEPRLWRDGMLGNQFQSDPYSIIWNLCNVLVSPAVRGLKLRPPSHR